MKKEEKKEIVKDAEATKEVSQPQKKEVIINEPSPVNAGVEFSSVDSEPQEFKVETKEDKKGVKDHDSILKDLEEGDAVISSSNATSDLSVLSQGLVADPRSGRPVYATSEGERIALGSSGNPYTPGASK